MMSINQRACVRVRVYVCVCVCARVRRERAMWFLLIHKGRHPPEVCLHCIKAGYFSRMRERERGRDIKIKT